MLCVYTLHVKIGAYYFMCHLYVRCIYRYGHMRYLFMTYRYMICVMCIYVAYRYVYIIICVICMYVAFLDTCIDVPRT